MKLYSILNLLEALILLDLLSILAAILAVQRTYLAYLSDEFIDFCMLIGVSCIQLGARTPHPAFLAGFLSSTGRSLSGSFFVIAGNLLLIGRASNCFLRLFCCLACVSRELSIYMSVFCSFFLLLRGFVACSLLFVCRI